MRSLATLELAGNALCLDFANTINSRLVPEHDYLATASAVVAWAVHAGALTDPAHAAQPPLRAAHALRDTVHAVFAAIAAGQAPAPADLAALSAAHALAMAHAVLTASAGGTPSTGGGGLAAGFTLAWPAPVDPLWPVARSAVELLLTANLSRVSACPGCGWLFLDTSRNGSRRWCSMATCGARDKMARYRTP